MLAMIVSSPPRPKIISIPLVPAILPASAPSPINVIPVSMVFVSWLVPLPNAACAGLKKRMSTTKSCVPTNPLSPPGKKVSKSTDMTCDVSLPKI